MKLLSLPEQFEYFYCLFFIKSWLDYFYRMNITQITTIIIPIIFPRRDKQFIKRTNIKNNNNYTKHKVRKFPIATIRA